MFIVSKGLPQSHISTQYNKYYTRIPSLFIFRHRVVRSIPSNRAVSV